MEVLGLLRFYSVKIGRALFSAPDTAHPHTSQEAFIASGVEKKIQMEETVWKACGAQGDAVRMLRFSLVAGQKLSPMRPHEIFPRVTS